MHTLTAQVPDKLASELNTIAENEGRSKSWVIKEAIADYIAKQKDLKQMIMEGLTAARKGKLIPHSEILKDLEKWGTK